MNRRAILDALEARYEAQIAEADATIGIYLSNSVGIGEHPQHLDEVRSEERRVGKECRSRWSPYH